MLQGVGGDVAGLRFNASSAVRNLDIKSTLVEDEKDGEFTSPILGCVGSEFTDDEEGGVQVIGRYVPPVES
nr:hypothetical protein [Streptomyces sioyaensis]